MSKNNKDRYKSVATDSAINNLMRTDDAELNGDFIKSDPKGGFQSINTPVCGIEVDVDEL